MSVSRLQVRLSAVVRAFPAAPPCEHQHPEFVASIAAPGYGQSWKCSDCGEPMWSPGGAKNAVAYADLDEVPELGIEDVI